MRAIGLVAIILLLVFILPVYADDAGAGDLTITFTTSKEWLVANGADSCQATVQVKNPTVGVPGLKIEFSVIDTDHGSFDQPIVYTDTEGKAVSTFKVSHKSGNATLKAAITDPSGTIPVIAPKELTQKIDHDTPWGLSSYEVISETTVDTIVPITMVYQDRWGNPVDDKRVAETVKFMVSAPVGDAVFQESNAIVAIVPVNNAGEAITQLQVSTKASINTVRVNPDMGSVPDKYFFIQGVAERAPDDITVTFNPDPPTVSIKGDNKITISYMVIDKFGNGIGNTPVTITTSIGEDYSRYTTPVGKIVLSYGPKNSIGNIVFDATATDPSGNQPTREDTVSFVAQDVQALQFTANPSIMPSRDTIRWQPAVLKAKLVDQNGYPVVGESVAFTLVNTVYEETPDPPVRTNEPKLAATPDRDATPELSTINAQTDSNGFATVYFKPGGFTTDKNDPNYDDSASGTCTVIATWQGETKTLQLSWMNYPYLSVETVVSPQTVKVGEDIEVTVRVKGDGYALMPTPIDAILCTDRSGSMLKDNPDRMVSVMEASRAFTDAMQVNPNQDRIGLVSFGGKGVAQLSPEYVDIYDDKMCYNPSTGLWETKKLEGKYWDWTHVAGMFNQKTGIPTIGFHIPFGDGQFIYVSDDMSWDMDESIAYSSYWPYTETFETSSPHQIYVMDHYPRSPRVYAEYAEVESSLENNTAVIYEAIDGMVPSGYTPMRLGLYKAIQEIKIGGADRPDAIRAIILLSDGDYNYYGDPLARGAQTTNYDLSKLTQDYWHIDGLSDSDENFEQNLAVYAKNNNIRIYSIGYTNKDLTTGGIATLQILAESTDGFYRSGGTAAEISQIYIDIADDLKQEAGVDTIVNLDYNTIEVNDISSPVTDTLEYISPTVIKSSYFDSEPQSKEIDQSLEYSVNKKLDFNLRTVNLGDIWEATYKLRVVKSGSINVFGPSSSVTFTTAEEPPQTVTIMVPKTYITAIEKMETMEIPNPLSDIPPEVPEDPIKIPPGYITLS